MFKKLCVLACFVSSTCFSSFLSTVETELEPFLKHKWNYLSFCRVNNQRELFKQGFQEGVEKGASHMFALKRYGWSGQDVPFHLEFIFADDNPQNAVNRFFKEGWFTHEIYALDLDLESQLGENCAWHTEIPSADFPPQINDIIKVQVMFNRVVYIVEISLDADVYVLMKMIEEKIGIKPANQCITFMIEFGGKFLHRGILRENAVSHGLRLEVKEVPEDYFEDKD